MVAIAKAVPVLESINPATEEVLAVFPTTSPQQIEQTLQSTLKAFRHWRDQSFDYRADLLRQAAAYLRSNQERLASPDHFWRWASPSPRPRRRWTSQPGCSTTTPIVPLNS